MQSLIAPFQYMAWAQSLPGTARLNLAQSGVEDVASDAAGDVPPGLFDPLDVRAMSARGPDGRAHHDRFMRAVSERYGVDPSQVTPSLGASLSILHVLMALVRAGDEVIVERPAYEALYRAPEALGAKVIRLDRRLDEGWVVDPGRLEALITSRTRCVLLTNLHNPSGALLTRENLSEVGALCAARDVFVLVDEVYLDFTFDSSQDAAAGPAALHAETGVSWSSSTKCFGVSAARAGWIVTRHAGALAAIKDASRYLHVDVPVATAAMGARVLEHADALTHRAVSRGRRGQSIVREWAAQEPRVRWHAPRHGLCGLLELPPGTDAVAFNDRLLATHETLVVPGDLFECPGAVRLGFGGHPDRLRRVCGPSRRPSTRSPHPRPEVFASGPG